MLPPMTIVLPPLKVRPTVPAPFWIEPEKVSGLAEVSVKIDVVPDVLSVTVPVPSNAGMVWLEPARSSVPPVTAIVEDVDKSPLLEPLT